MRCFALTQDTKIRPLNLRKSQNRRSGAMGGAYRKKARSRGCRRVENFFQARLRWGCSGRHWPRERLRDRI